MDMRVGFLWFRLSLPTHTSGALVRLCKQWHPSPPRASQHVGSNYREQRLDLKERMRGEESREASRDVQHGEEEPQGIERVTAQERGEARKEQRGEESP